MISVPSEVQRLNKKLLIIDMTPSFGYAATSTIKANLFDIWPKENIALVSSMTKGRLDISQPNDVERRVYEGVSELDIWRLIELFNPDFILYRPVADRKDLHILALEVIEKTQVPYFIWIMDDWLERLKENDFDEFEYFDASVRLLLQGSTGNLSISDIMSDVFEQRYTTPFVAVANGVDVEEWKPYYRECPANNNRGHMVVKYTGGLAPDMNLDTVMMLAECIESLSYELNISLKINTQKHWAVKFKGNFNKFKSTQFSSVSMDTSQYRKWLASADLNVLAYNFDESSIRYTKYSKANKLPECMAACAPILAIGPGEINTISTVNKLPFVSTVTENCKVAIRKAIRDIYYHPVGAREKSEQAVSYVEQFASKNYMQRALISVFSKAGDLFSTAVSLDKDWRQEFAEITQANEVFVSENVDVFQDQHLMKFEKNDQDCFAEKKISIVVPNYNGGDHIEETLKSIVNQNYHNYELIVVDGASTDLSLEVIEKYSDYIDVLISEPDNGHADAINKGFAKASGDVLTWLNSDDVFTTSAFYIVNRLFSGFEEVQWLTSRPTHIDKNGIVFRQGEPMFWSKQRFLAGDFRYIQQEGTFWSRTLWEQSGECLNESYRLAIDLDLWCRFFDSATLYTVDTALAYFRKHDGQRSQLALADYNEECSQILKKFFNDTSVSYLEKNSDVLPSTFDCILWNPHWKVNPELDRYDPPLLKYNLELDKYCMFDTHKDQWLRKNVIPECVKSYSTLHYFDNQHKLDFYKGPDFSGAELRKLSLVIRKSTCLKIPLETDYSDQYPSTIIVCGSVSVMQLDRDLFRVQFKGANGFFHHDIECNHDNGIIDFEVSFIGSKYLIKVNGHIVSQQFRADEAFQHFKKNITLGAGFNDRYWYGDVLKLEVLTNVNGIDSLWSVGNSEINHAKLIMRDFVEGRADITGKNVPVSDVLSRFKGKHKGERCFVMGCGPSLNKMDLSLFEDETVISCNGAFLLFDRIKWRPRYYTCVDTRVLMDRHFDIKKMIYDYPDITSFFPSQIKVHGEGRVINTRELIGMRDSTYYFNEVSHNKNALPQSMFSTDAGSRVVMPFTVTITMLQLAVYMGFKEIYLIGCDTSYSIPDSVKQSGDKIMGVGLHLEGGADDDTNHFDPTYFGKGRKYHNPQTHNMIAHYELAKSVSDEIDTKIYNATVGGMLEVFPRVDYQEILMQKNLSNDKK